MTRSIMTKIFVAAAVLLLALSVLSGCCIAGGRTVRLSGAAKETVVYGTGSSEGWTVKIEKLSFSGEETPVIRLIPSDAVRVEAAYNADFEDYGFDITVKNGVIRIGTDYSHNYIGDVFEITVYADFDKVELSGGCNLDIDASGAEVLTLDISGASDCFVRNAEARRLEIELSGAADIEMEGTAVSFVVGLSGAADIDAKALVSSEADVRVSGAGNVALSVTDTLRARISGVGSVVYYGSPVVTSNVSGLGEVKQESENLYGE